jgi:hypothetical protein
MSRSMPGFIIATVFGLSAMPSCDDDARWSGGNDIDLHCRSFPGDCDGEIGSFCRVDDDCDLGICCRGDQDEDCGAGGLCTFLCQVPTDCPREMVCDQGLCFFSCSGDDQCAPGQECHDDVRCAY